MKSKLTRPNTVAVALAVLMASFAPAAFADKCSTRTVAGDWGFTLTGTLILPTGPVLGAAVATLNVDKAGIFTGAEARNVGGGFSNETINGSWTVNSDCTGVATAYIYESGVLVRTSVLSVVFDEDSTEMRMVQQSLTLPDGTTLPVVITLEGRKQHSDH